MNMKQTPPHFDLFAAALARDVGLARVSSFPNDSWIAQARSMALILAAKQGEITINDVLQRLPRPDHIHPNAVGSVMRCKELKKIGYTKSSKVSSHARAIGIYTLVR